MTAAGPVALVDSGEHPDCRCGTVPFVVQVSDTDGRPARSAPGDPTSPAPD
jgi:hypothetical protein